MTCGTWASNVGSCRCRKRVVWLARSWGRGVTRSRWASYSDVMDRCRLARLSERGGPSDSKASRGSCGCIRRSSTSRASRCWDGGVRGRYRDTAVTRSLNG